MTYQKKRQGGWGVTPAQDQLAAFVRAAMKGGRLPSIQEMQEHMGWQRHSVRDCLKTMGRSGKLPLSVIERLLAPAASRERAA